MWLLGLRAVYNPFSPYILGLSPSLSLCLSALNSLDMIRLLSHAHRPFSLREFVSVMPNLAIYFHCTPHLWSLSGFFSKKDWKLEWVATHAPPKAAKHFQPDPDYDVKPRGPRLSWLLYQLPCICAAIEKKKKRRQRERTGTKACCRRGRTPPSLHKPGILRPRPSLCFRTVSHSIGSPGTELFGRGPSALPKAEKLSKCKLKCVCFSVESQNDLSLLNGISYMCWVRWFIMGGNGN